MGASGWIYFVPYQADIRKALQELKEAVFQRGEYYTEAKFLSRINKEEMQDILRKLPSDYFEKIQDRRKQLQNQPPPSNIQELLEMNGDSGTHSIIDMQDFSETFEFGKITPVLQQDLTHLFGAEKPTREMVERKIDEIQGLCQRWDGVYLVIFRDGLPNELLFAGISGD